MTSFSSRRSADRSQRKLASWVGLLVLLALAGPWGGCSDPQSALAPPEPARLDLGAALGAADFWAETPRLRLADPEQRFRLGPGWGQPESDSSGPFVWIVGRRAELEFFLVEPRDLELVVYGRSFFAEGAPPQELTLAVEQTFSSSGERRRTEVGKRRLDAKVGVHRFTLPTAALEAGVQRLIFELSQTYEPRQWIAGSVDDRPLALQVHSLEIRDVGAPTLAPIEDVGGEMGEGGKLGRAEGSSEGLGDGSVEIPVGTGLVWYVEARAGERLWLSQASDASADLRLAVVPGPRALEPYHPSAGVEGRAMAATAGSPNPPKPEPGSSTDLGPFLVGPGDTLDLPLEEGRVTRIALIAQPHRSWLSSLFGTEPASAVARPALAILGGERRPAEVETAAPESLSDPQPSSPRGPNILVYMVDTLRADRLGAYGYDRPTSPNLDRLARDGVVFTEARAQTSWTRTAVVSVFTGLYPQTHGVNDREDALPDASATTLAEYLREAGYRTVGVVTNGNAGPKFGLGQGFEVYQHLRESTQRRDVHHLSDVVREWIGTWLGGYLEQDDRPPFLLYAHATDPHAPYTPHEPWKSLLAPEVDGALGELEDVRVLRAHEPLGTRLGLTAEPGGGLAPTWADLDPDSARLGHQLGQLYDAEIAFFDHQFGLLVEDLKRLDLYDEMTILVLSDHGEEFFDHGGWEHGRTLYEEQLRVPLILKLPHGRGAGSRIDGTADQVDVLPTLLDLVGLPIPADIDGTSLLPRLAAESSTPGEGSGPGATAAGAGETASQRPVASDRPERVSLAYLGLEGRDQRSLVRRGFKWSNSKADREGLFQGRRTQVDPSHFDEVSNLAWDRPWLAGLLRQEARRLEAELGAHRRVIERADIDPELREQLKALGYIP